MCGLEQLQRVCSYIDFVLVSLFSPAGSMREFFCCSSFSCSLWRSDLQVLRVFNGKCTTVIWELHLFAKLTTLAVEARINRNVSETSVMNQGGQSRPTKVAKTMMPLRKR